MPYFRRNRPLRPPDPIMGCEGPRKVIGDSVLIKWIPYLLNSYRLRTSNILLINIKALANEIAKNLVLAGIGSLTIIDSEVVRDDDLGSQFFVSEEQIGLNVLVLGLLSFVSLLIPVSASRGRGASDPKA